MDVVWQWVWDRFGTRYSWATYLLSALGALFPLFALVAFLVLRFEGADAYLAGAVLALVAALTAVFAVFLPGSSRWRLIERWAAGDHADPRGALKSTYMLIRSTVVRGIAAFLVVGGAMTVAVGAIAGASPAQLVQYAVLGAAVSLGIVSIAMHDFLEVMIRPARAAIAGARSIGDDMPRSRPTFAFWSTLAIVGVAWNFSLLAVLTAAIVDGADRDPILAVAIAFLMVLFFAVPLTVGTSTGPALRPLRDLSAATERIVAGDYSVRVPVLQDDDLGALSASFNRMQAGLAQRERLQAAFGSYVDPTLAARLLDQGDDVFAGERREVTVMFVDVRDFTPFAEANTADVAVAELNALFEIVVPAVIDAGGHVNKYLGDGAMAVFGAPNALEGHADAAVGAAIVIDRMVRTRFGGRTRIGVGINTGQVIAGTIGGGGKLEFTLIGDTVNVAARVEQLTKETGDTILLTQHTLDALTTRPPGLIDRGAHALKGKAARVAVHALAPSGSQSGH